LDIQKIIDAINSDRIRITEHADEEAQAARCRSMRYLAVSFEAR
jgi:hypothetical protein